MTTATKAPSADRNTVLATLGDYIREIGDPDDLAFAAAELLGRSLNVSRAGYGTIDTSAETITINRDWNAPSIASLAGVLHFRDYGSYIENLKRGETVVCADARKDPRVGDRAPALEAISARSLVNMPVSEPGGVVALLYLNNAAPREWSTAEIELIREVAETFTGFLATEDPVLAARVRQLTTFGFKGSRDSLIPATNAKLSEYAAAVGLAALDGWPGDRLRWMRTAQHLRIAAIGRPEVKFQDGWSSDWVTSVCTVALPDGSAHAVARSLAEDGVDTRQWWGGGCHTSQAFADCRREALPVTEALAAATLGLPFSIDMEADEIARVAAALDRALSRG